MPDEISPIRTDIPHSARIWNYWMGGKDNYEIDRAAGDAGIAVYPDITRMATESRQFLIRAAWLRRSRGLGLIVRFGG